MRIEEYSEILINDLKKISPEAKIEKMQDLMINFDDKYVFLLVNLHDTETRLQIHRCKNLERVYTMVIYNDKDCVMTSPYNYRSAFNIVYRELFNATICAHCGKLLKTDSAELIRLNYVDVCKDCCEKLYDCCEECHKMELKENFKEIDGERVCSACQRSCINTDFPENETHLSKNCFYSSNKWYYKKYLEEKGLQIVRCTCCGSDKLSSDITDFYGYKICKDCKNSQNREDSSIRGYHRDPLRFYFDDENKPSCEGKKFKGFGIELEVETSDSYDYDDEYDDDDYDDDCEREDFSGFSARSSILRLVDYPKLKEIYYEHDGSLSNGFEIITQPHTEKSFKNMRWKEILEKLKEEHCLSHDTDTCGYHIHVSRNLFGEDEDEQEDNIAKVIMFYEYFWEEILRFSRRTSGEIGDWAARYSLSRGDIEIAKEISKDKNKGRYYAVNCENSNTIEFRIFKGTLNYETFMASFDLTARLVENSKNISWDNLYELKLWLNGIEENTINYMKKRNCFEEFYKGENE